MRYIKWAMILVVVVVLMRTLHITPTQLGSLASKEIDRFQSDVNAVKTGEYKERIANSYREAAQSQPMAVVVGDEKGDLQRELSDARKQMLKDRADALEKHAGEIMRGDAETLKQQVSDNANKAGGGF